jgi:hypothetical protein
MRNFVVFVLGEEKGLGVGDKGIDRNLQNVFEIGSLCTNTKVVEHNITLLKVEWCSLAFNI